jgi:hypothetical protein
MLQHSFYNGIGSLAMMVDLFLVGFYVIRYRNGFFFISFLYFSFQFLNY